MLENILFKIVNMCFNSNFNKEATFIKFYRVIMIHFPLDRQGQQIRLLHYSKRILKSRFAVQGLSPLTPLKIRL